MMETETLHLLHMYTLSCNCCSDRKVCIRNFYQASVSEASGGIQQSVLCVEANPRYRSTFEAGSCNMHASKTQLTHISWQLDGSISHRGILKIDITVRQSDQCFSASAAVSSQNIAVMSNS